MLMKQRKFFQNKHIIVLGLAKSGVSVARLLHKLGAKVTVNELQEKTACPDATELEALGITVICGSHPLTLLEQNVAMIVKNPGIPFDIPFLKEAELQGIPIFTEIEIGYLVSKAPIIGITGSNGKTTTTTLVWEMLREGGKKPLIAGNIGTVFCDVASEAAEDQWIVAELSSFQLLGTERFQPEISVLLNIFDAHLDYHHHLDHYIQAKMKLFSNQTHQQVSVINYDYPVTRQLATQLAADVYWFSVEQEVPRGTFVHKGMIMHKDGSGRLAEVIPLTDVVLPGKHNLANITAAITAGRAAGASFQHMATVIRSFQGVPHRLQFISEINGVRYYNDSKATNMQATEQALCSFAEPIVLIAGGLDRGDDFTEMIPYFKNKLKGLIVYGQVAQHLLAAGQEAGVKRIIHVDTVSDAVRSAAQIATAGDVVLLSPAAASWDQFRSFEERGDMFVKSVHMLK